MQQTHKYFRFDPSPPKKDLVRQLGRYILNRYVNADNAISKWRKLGNLSFQWQHQKLGQQTGVVSFAAVEEFLSTKRSFDSKRFNLPDLLSPFLDGGTDVSLPQPLMGTDGSVGFQLPTNMGKAFPVTPFIDREGIAISNLQGMVEGNIAPLLRRLVDNSQLALDVRSGWFSDFRMLLNECVSVVDITLHHIYLLAEYQGRELGWKFDREEFGTRHGTRLADKFAWIGKATGRPLDNAPEYIATFKKLKDLRNHLTHFDPPCFAATVEDIQGWLNDVSLVGVLLWKIREKLNHQLNPRIVEICLVPKVLFFPLHPQGTRPPPNTTNGYPSSCWPSP